MIWKHVTKAYRLYDVMNSCVLFLTLISDTRGNSSSSTLQWRYSDPEHLICFIAGQFAEQGCLHGYRVIRIRTRIRKILCKRMKQQYMTMCQNKWRYCEMMRKICCDLEVMVQEKCVCMSLIYTLLSVSQPLPERYPTDSLVYREFITWVWADSSLIKLLYNLCRHLLKKVNQIQQGH